MSGVSGQLPWGWFTALALVDAGLAYLVVGRRLRGHVVRDRDARAAEPTATEQRLRVHGWWVSPSRATTLQGRAALPDWRWTVHREVLRRSIYPLHVSEDELDLVA